MISVWDLEKVSSIMRCPHFRESAFRESTICTHVAAVLFYLEAVYRMRGQETCTQQMCQWILPSFQKNVEYLPIASIDFTSAYTKKRKLDNALDDLNAATSQQMQVNDRVTRKELPSHEEMERFYESLSKSRSKPAILSLIKPYSDKYIPVSTQPQFPLPLNELYKPIFESLRYDELLDVCELIEVPISEGEARAVQEETVSQFQSKSWFQYRAGRITASRMKAVCRTDYSLPSQSLIKSICYPDQFRFKTKATTWGCTHEKAARRRYVSKVKDNHRNFSIKESGLVINPQWSFIGATPDGLVYCDCCGHGVIEIKCPYCHRSESISDAMEDKNFCLKNVNDEVHLDEHHAYYYQVQTQLSVCDVTYCDFVVCTFSDPDDLYVERLSKNSTFWSECVAKADLFFRFCLLPELLGKWYTKGVVGNTPACSHSEPTVTQESEATASELMDQESGATTTGQENVATTSYNDATASGGENLYCYCNGPEEGTMIACDNRNCKIEWYHLTCLRYASAPKGKWYCPECRTLPEFSRSRKKGKK